MKVAAQSMGCDETKLRSSNKIFSGESEVKEKLLSAQVRHYWTSTRRTFSKLPKGRVQPTRVVLWCNQVISVLIAFISMPYIVLSKLTDFCVRSVKLGWIGFFKISVFNEAPQNIFNVLLIFRTNFGQKKILRSLFPL